VLRYMILTDARLGLLAPPQTADPTLAAAFDDLRTAIRAIRSDRNTKVSHEMRLSNAEYDEAIRNVRRFAVACVDKCGLFDAAWKERLLTTVTAVSVARYTRHDPKIEEFARHQREGTDEEVEELPQTRGGWSAVTSMGPTDVIVVGGRRVDEGSVYVLPDDEQNHRRLFDLHFGVVRDALQEVSCAPQLMRALAHSLSHITDNLSDSRYSEYHQSHRDSLSQ
jgi:hypothetical protein